VVATVIDVPHLDWLRLEPFNHPGIVDLPGRLCS
jgi:hypothetical protein